MIEKVKILNADVLSVTQEALLHQLKSGVLVTPNLDHLVKLQQDREFYDVYQQAEWVICDSRILYFLSKLLKRSFPEAIPGSSFFTAFYEYHRDDQTIVLHPSSLQSSRYMDQSSVLEIYDQYCHHRHHFQRSRRNNHLQC